MLSFKRDDWSNRGRGSGLKAFATPTMAVLLCLTSVAVVAQTATFDFEDPLEQVQTQIREQQQAQPAPPQTPASPSGTARDWAASAVQTADRGISGAVDRANAGADALSERTGLAKTSLLGLIAAGLVGLAALLGWLLFRRRGVSAPSRRGDSGLYAANGGARARTRRTLDSGAEAMRAKRAAVSPPEPEKAAPAASEDQPVIFKRPPPRATMVDAEPDAQNPETWKRPNLDRLKASIRADWAAGEQKPEPKKTSAFDDEDAKAYAELFGDDSPAAAPAPRQGESVLDLLDTFEAKPEAADALAQAAQEPVEELRKAVQSENADLHRQARAGGLSHAEAVRRVRALRDSVRAS